MQDNLATWQIILECNLSLFVVKYPLDLVVVFTDLLKLLRVPLTAKLSLLLSFIVYTGPDLRPVVLTCKINDDTVNFSQNIWTCIHCRTRPAHSWFILWHRLRLQRRLRYVLYHRICVSIFDLNFWLLFYWVPCRCYSDSFNCTSSE